MYTVKISAQDNELPLLRQTPGGKGVWNNVQFFFNDSSIKKCDYWIIYEGISRREVTVCPKENVVLITGEPPPIKKYKIHFLKQFSKIITCQHELEHQNKIYWQQALPWHIGWRQNNSQIIGSSKDYDELKNMMLKSTCKNKICSVISSNSTSTQGHRDRIKFTEILKMHFGDKIDFFGRGFNEIEDKWDAIASYKYHIVIENSSFEDYWTEKLADVFLGEAYPIYYGAKNIYSYFDKDSLITIDIYNPEEAIKIIEKVINENYYERYKHKIIESKNKILDEYNLFPTIINKIINGTSISEQGVSKILLKPESYFSDSTIKNWVKPHLPMPIIKLIRRIKKFVTILN